MPRLVCAICLVLFSMQPAFAGVSHDLAGFQQHFAEVLEANDIPGAGVALIRNGEIEWAGGIGYADIDEDRHVLGTTRFRIGSITKMFTALAVLQLVESGELSLDQPVLDIAPDLPIDNSWSETDPVRVAHLLEHTAGFDDMHFRNMNTDDVLPESLADVVQSLDDELQVRWRPGVKHSYSNPGYAIAGYLVERISGQPFHEYVNEKVLAPLGMPNATWGMPADKAFAQGYTRNGKESRAVRARAIRLYPAGELSASPSEMARLVQLFLQRGELHGKRLVSAMNIERMETPHTTRAARHGLTNGYGLGNYVSFRNGFRMHGHNGGLDGFMAELAYSPDHDFGYVVLINRADPGALRVLSEVAVEYLAGDVAAPGPGERDVMGTTLPVAIEGCYRMSNPRNELLHGLEWLVQVACVRNEEDRAVLRHPVLPQVTALIPVRDALLRESGEAWPTAVFMHDAEDADALEWSSIYFERSSRLSTSLPLFVAIIALSLMLSALVFFPVWLVRWWRGSLREAPALTTRIWPLLASTLFGVTLFAATRLELALLDSVNVVTSGVFVGGVAFVLTSFYALYRVVFTWNTGIHPVAKWHSLLVSLACVIIAIYLLYWRLVPLRLWAW